ncbi:P-loop containing nucleoside triphosphate hydrolase protein [Flagelloscypha sp. PMI_526]|nr:P-loop containing nucleoside triphosphate hydrolase protein [Flagelloscypha sp. PMI_526]
MAQPLAPSILYSNVPHESVSAPATLSFSEDNKTPTRRSSRVKMVEVSVSSKKRKAQSHSAPVTQKRAKVESQAAVDKAASRASEIFTRLPDRANTRRNKFLLAHKDVLRPLLPENSRFFDNLAQQLKRGSSLRILPRQPVAQPTAINGAMKDYQLEGLSFLSYMYKNGMNCILGDEMGLGKTLQTLSLFAWVQENTSGPHAPHLVICPLSVLDSWVSEVKRWLPNSKLCRFHGAAAERSFLKNQLKSSTHDFTKSDFDIMVTTYDAFVSEDSWFKSRRWSILVLDEGHKIKNSATLISSKIQTVGALSRLILTGTPVQNNLLELWSLLHFLFPTLFTPTTANLFQSSFDLSRGSYSLHFMEKVKALLPIIMLRRTKDTIPELTGEKNGIPPREEQDIFLPMTELQNFWYVRMLTKVDRVNLEHIFSETSIGSNEYDAGRQEIIDLVAAESQDKSKNSNNWTKLMNLLLQLRRICDHPYLLLHAEPDPWSIGEHIVAGSSKLVFIDKLTKELLPKGEKILIFSQWTEMLNNVEDLLFMRGIRYARLDGSTSRPRRGLDIRLFQQDDDRIQVFIISTTAGGLGINLTRASTVVMCDATWNPQNDLQAIARAHRIGQTKVVKVYRLICSGSVEDQMNDRLRRKLYLSHKIMSSAGSSDQDMAQPTLGSSELLDILRRGTGALASEDQLSWKLNDFLNASLDDIVSLSKKIQDGRSAMLQKSLTDSAVDLEDLGHAEEEEKRLLAGMAQVRSRVWQGELISVGGPSKDNREIRKEWDTQQKKRERANNLVMFNGIEHLQVKETPLAIPERKRTKGKHEHEEWCIVCRDGGHLHCCSACPKVFHLECIGLTEADMKKRKLKTQSCPHHICATCEKPSQNVGGMLFRCRTCPQAFCEDCLPEDGLEYIGDVLPEHQVLGYNGTSTAYYVRCQDCVVYHSEDSEGIKAWEEWQQEFRDAEKTLKRRDF